MSDTPVVPQPHSLWPPAQLHSDCAIATEAKIAKAMIVKRIAADIPYEVGEDNEIMMEKAEDCSKMNLTLYPSIIRL